MKKLLVQIIKFGFVGVISTIVDYGIFVFLTKIIGVNYLIANCFSFSISLIVNYILNIKYVFQSEEGANKVHEFIIYIFLNLIGLGINQLILWALVSKFQMNYLIAKIIAIGFVMGYNFISRKIFIEKRTI